MEASHDAQSDHVRIDDVLLHLLSLAESPRLLHLELGILCDTLNDGQRDSRVLLDIVLSEVFERVINLLKVTVTRIGAILLVLTEATFLTLLMLLVA